MTGFSQGDKVEVNMPGMPLHEMRGKLEVRPGLKVAEVRLSNGQVRIIPTKRLRKVP